MIQILNLNTQRSHKIEILSKAKMSLVCTCVSMCVLTAQLKKTLGALTKAILLLLCTHNKLHASMLQFSFNVTYNYVYWCIQ